MDRRSTGLLAALVILAGLLAYTAYAYPQMGITTSQGAEGVHVHQHGPAGRSGHMSMMGDGGHCGAWRERAQTMAQECHQRVHEVMNGYYAKCAEPTGSEAA